MRVLFAAAAVAAACFSVSDAALAEAKRVVSIGGDVTEIVYALGEEGRLVGADETALYPKAALALPKVGYMRTLAAEGLLSLQPDLVIATAHAGPPAVFEQLSDAKVPVAKIPGDESIAGVLAKIDAVAAALGVPDKAVSLKASVEARMAAVEKALQSATDSPKVMFLLAQGPGGAMAAGKHTAADAMIGLAHATNVATGFDGYKPLTAESAVSLAPDYIIVAEHSVSMMGGLDALKQRPEIAITPAGQNGKVIVMDSLLLLGFGPRTPDAIAALAATVHPDVKIDLAAAQ